MFNWDYTSPTETSTGYEDVMNQIDIISPDDFNLLDDAAKDEVVEKIFNVVRSKNIFPIYYFNEDGIKKEIVKCIGKDVKLNKVVDEKSNAGQYVCMLLFKNLHQVQCKGAKGNSMYDRFYDDHKLKKTIRFALTYERLRNIYSGLYRNSRLIGGNVATNFPPMKAKSIYEKYCPQNGVIFDYSCGFGGRMLGALTSKNNYKYFGVDPCTETYENLKVLGGYIESVTGRKNSFKVLCSGSENINYHPLTADFAFSSPPYFNLESYSDEDTQCYIKFGDIESWIAGYVKPTIQNIYGMLKHNRFYAVNIADFNVGNKKVQYVDRWIEASKEVGFDFVEKLEMKLQTRKGSGHKDDNGIDKPKSEGVYVFYKN